MVNSAQAVLLSLVSQTNLYPLVILFNNFTIERIFGIMKKDSSVS